jgi:hypothetical protein
VSTGPSALAAVAPDAFSRCGTTLRRRRPLPPTPGGDRVNGAMVAAEEQTLGWELGGGAGGWECLLPSHASFGDDDFCGDNAVAVREAKEGMHRLFCLPLLKSA